MSASGVNIVCFGEVLWDLLPSGPQPGGAPANFACHVAALGAYPKLVSRVGNDAQGRDVVNRLSARGVDCSTVQIDPIAPTGTVAVTLLSTGVPHFTIGENVAWDAIHATPEARRAAQTADAIYFGTLAQRGASSRDGLRGLLDDVSATALRVLDLNLRAPFWNPEIIRSSLAAANVVKLNEDELLILAPLLGLAGDEHECLAELGRRYQLRAVALTCGAAGSLLWRAGQFSAARAETVAIRDTVGAGDAFAAVVVLGLLRDRRLDEINANANAVAAFVCSQPGATPPLPVGLTCRLNPDAGCIETTAECFENTLRHVAPFIRQP